jgi:DNA-binding GntR family transcriptional regulator
MKTMRAPALAIASSVRARDGAAASAEILEHFALSQSTLRRRWPELARLGIVFVEDGNRSFYATRELTHQLPTNYPPKDRVQAETDARTVRARPSTTEHDPTEPLPVPT